MVDILFVFVGKEVGIDMGCGECVDGKWGNEFLSVCCYDWVYMCFLFLEVVDEIEVFVGCNVIGND